MCSTASLRGRVDTLHIPMRLPQPVGPVIMPIAYRVRRIPRWFASEGIVLCGHLIAPAGVDGFGYLTKTWGGALVAAWRAATCVTGAMAHTRVGPGNASTAVNCSTISLIRGPFPTEKGLGVCVHSFKAVMHRIPVNGKTTSTSEVHSHT